MAYSGNRAPRQVTLPALSFDDKNISCIIRVRKSAPNQTNCRRKHRSEEHTSELQSQLNLVCRLLLEKKKNIPQGLSVYMRASPPLRGLYPNIRRTADYAATTVLLLRRMPRRRLRQPCPDTAATDASV